MNKDEKKTIIKNKKKASSALSRVGSINYEEQILDYAKVFGSSNSAENYYNNPTEITTDKSSKNADFEDSQKVNFIEEIVNSVHADFEERSSDRLAFESQWQLNANFVIGNQFCAVGINGELDDIERDYFWQEREVYNHIAPIIETRLAKLGRVRPKMSVRPFSADEDDIKTSKASTKILSSACNRIELESKISNATYWSELTGTAFYKITWDKSAGKKVGEINGAEVFEGDIKIDVCPPYEIYPSSLSAQNLEECSSLIHAKAVEVSEIKRIYGVEVEAQDVDIVSLSNINMIGGLGMSSAVPKVNRTFTNGSCIVIERYSRASAEKPNGELAIVANGKLLFYGNLPYCNGEDGRRDFPFVRQEAVVHAGCFYGLSMVERAIPIQRAYNAVKNRKHEFMNRIAVGVLAVEDGSVDTENLVEEGLSPGKILVYRQGSSMPRLLEAGHVPTDFSNEEDRLLSEFIAVSGVSEIMRSSSVPAGVSSGVALQMLIEQDDTRLAVTAEHIRTAIKFIAKHILRLYKQFVSSTRLARVIGEEGEAEILTWNNSLISCDDVVFDTENEINTTPASKQNMMFELLKMGLLSDSEGKISDAMRYKILDTLGYGGWEFTKDIMTLHVARAEKENMKAKTDAIEVSEIDEHAMHINVHTKFMLSTDFEKMCKKQPQLNEKMLNHIREHKQQMSISVEMEGKPNE